MTADSLDALLAAQLSRCLDASDLSTLPSLRGAARYVGKVRDNYTRGDRRLIVVTDRVSAFDVVLGTIPFKGQVLNRLAADWFAASRHVAPNHLVAVVDPAASLAIACAPIPVEFVMRGYLTGVTTTSVWHHYQKGERVYCGHALPDGMRKNERFAEPLLTPTTKADQGGHDQPVSRAEVLAGGLCDEATFDEAARMARALFAFGQARAAERGLLLVDTKYEIGRAPASAGGGLLFIDEIHTPDSSRFWYADDHPRRLAAGEDPRALDKEFIRRWYAARGYTGDGPPPPMDDAVRVEAARRYIEAYERITGDTFVPDTEEPTSRLRDRLRDLAL